VKVTLKQTDTDWLKGGVRWLVNVAHCGRHEDKELYRWKMVSVG